MIFRSLRYRDRDHGGYGPICEASAHAHPRNPSTQRTPGKNRIMVIFEYLLLVSMLKSAKRCILHPARARGQHRISEFAGKAEEPCHACS
jgi:hypothetical protein